MAAFYTLELGGTSGTSGATGSVDGLPATKPSATVGHGGRLRCFRGSYTLTGSAVTTSDTLNVCIVPAGSIYQAGFITSGVSLGSSTVSLGITGTLAKYRAASAFTVVDTQTPFLTAAVLANQTPLTGDERILATIAAANMPTSGQSLVIQFFASNG